MDTIAKVQSVIDTSDDGVPVIILGDFNTLLPQTETINNNWSKCRPFNRNSAMLYNFIDDNDLCVANFLFKQNVNFTYSNAAVSSYIDHVLVPDYVDKL